MKGTKMMPKQVLQNPADKMMSGVKCLAAIVDSSDFKCKLKWLLNYATHEPMVCHFGDRRQSAGTSWSPLLLHVMPRKYIQKHTHNTTQTPLPTYLKRKKGLNLPSTISR